MAGRGGKIVEKIVEKCHTLLPKGYLLTICVFHSGKVTYSSGEEHSRVF